MKDKGPSLNSTCPNLKDAKIGFLVPANKTQRVSWYDIGFGWLEVAINRIKVAIARSNDDSDDIHDMTWLYFHTQVVKVSGEWRATKKSSMSFLCRCLSCSKDSSRWCGGSIVFGRRYGYGHPKKLWFRVDFRFI